MDYYYEKINENLELVRCPMNDIDGSVTGRCVMNVPAWFDENPEERKRLGWIKHITHDAEEIGYNPQTQYCTKTQKVIDAYTVEDAYHVADKSPEMMRLEEIMESMNVAKSFGQGGIILFG